MNCRVNSDWACEAPYLANLDFHKMATAPKIPKDVEKRERTVKRIARELRDGFYVNLGIVKMACWASVLIHSKAEKIPI